MKYILFAMIVTHGHGGERVTVTTQEFGSQEACRAAKTKLEKELSKEFYKIPGVWCQSYSAKPPEPQP